MDGTMSRETAKRAHLLAARLAGREDWLAKALSHVYSPTWRPVLRSLGAVLDSRARIFVAALLRKNCEDLCCRPLDVAVSAAMAAGRQVMPTALLEKLAEQAIALHFDQTMWPPRAVSWAMLEACSEHAVPLLIGRLSSPDPIARARAAFVLGRLQAHEAIRELAGLLKDEDSLVREWSAMALGTLGSVAAVEPALLQAQHEESLVEHVARGMFMSPHPGDGITALTRCLEGKGREMKLRVARIRARHGLPLTVSCLLESLDTDDWNTRVWGAEIIGQGGPPEVLPHLIERSCHPSASVRWAAAMAVGCLGMAEGIPYLESLALDQDSHVRTAANDALAWNRAGKKVPTVRGWLGAAGNPRLVQEIRSPADAAEVAHQLGDGYPAVRKAALEAIARSGPESVVQWATSKLDDESQSDRWHAALALGEVGTAAVVPDLLRLLEDPIPFVRHAAVQATARLGWRLQIPIPVEQAPRPLQLRAQLLKTAIDPLASGIEG